MKEITLTVSSKEVTAQALEINGINIVNCMKHAALLQLPNSEKVLLKASGIEAKVVTAKGESFQIDKTFITMPTIIRSSGQSEIVGLPEPEENTFYYVNMITFKEAVKNGRSDVIMGDSSGTEIRYKIGDVFAGKVIESKSDKGFGLMKAVTHLIGGWQTADFQELLLKEAIDTEFDWANHHEYVELMLIDHENVTFDYRREEYIFKYKNLNIF